jgi:hypothetical protein
MNPCLGGDPGYGIHHCQAPGLHGFQLAPRIFQAGLLAGVLAVIDLEAGQLDLHEVKQGFDRSLGKG